MSSVHLIGTFHFDISLRDSMWVALDQLEPDILVGESNEQLEHRARHYTRVWAPLFEKLQVGAAREEIFHATHSHNELLIARQYACDHNIPYVGVDAPESLASPEELDQYSYVAFRNHLGDLIAAGDEMRAKWDLGRWIEKVFSIHARKQCEGHHSLYEEEYQVANTNPASLSGPRDRYMAWRIKRELASHSDATIVGFFGSAHIVDMQDLGRRHPEFADVKNMRYHLRDVGGISYANVCDFVSVNP